MSSSSEAAGKWHVVAVQIEDLEARLNELSQVWDVFSVLPELTFGAKMMGTPVPTAVQYRIVLRQPAT